MKKLIPLLLALALLLTGCAGEEAPQAPAAKDFSKAGLTVTLTDAFEENEHMGYTAIYFSQDLACMTLKEEFTLFENTDYSADSTLAEYAGLVWKSNALSGTVPLEEGDGLTWFEYDSEVNGNAYRYRAYAFKGTDAFWLVQFYTTTDRFDALSDAIHAYAKTVTVA